MQRVLDFAKDNPVTSVIVVTGLAVGTSAAVYYAFASRSGSKLDESTSMQDSTLPKRTAAAAAALHAVGLLNPGRPATRETSLPLAKAFAASAVTSKKCPSTRVVTKLGFQEAMRRAGFLNPDLPNHMFEVMDTDRSGELEEAELQTVFAVLQGTHERSMMEFAFDAIDTDDSGNVSSLEVERFTAALLRATGHRMLPTQIEQMTQRVWAAAGKLGDMEASLSQEEFVKAAHTARDSHKHSIPGLMVELGKVLKVSLQQVGTPLAVDDEAADQKQSGGAADPAHSGKQHGIPATALQKLHSLGQAASTGAATSGEADD